MSYQGMIAAASGRLAYPQVSPKVKLLNGPEGLTIPVLFSRDRMNRPFREYPIHTRADCPLCRRVDAGHVVFGVVPGMAWLPATYPIKSFHAICYPSEHRSAILPEDIVSTGRAVDAAGDAVAGLNVRGSAASIPEHSHTQIHDFSLPGAVAHAFPLLTRELEVIGRDSGLTLYRVLGYPSFALAVVGAWELVARFMSLYLAAANQRPHNFALAPGGKLLVIPRGLERAPDQENRFGASEMLGMITPVTPGAYESIQSADAICEALRVCGLTDEREKLAAEEHASWVCVNLRRGCGVHHAGA